MENNQNKPENPLVFPSDNLEWDEQNERKYVESQNAGISLRDYFAAKAMEKINYTFHPQSPLDAIKLFLRKLGFNSVVKFRKNFSLKEDIEQCYVIADAMLKERSKDA